jgi:2-polyprenyl-6-hydroxyphenyl methylase/3-demethylubiquinone-9 3-methyltransferase
MTDLQFDFGANWQRYARDVDDDAIEAAVAALADLLGDLRGRTVLDLGCGSGIHGLAALRLGCRHLTAVDVNPKSVATARGLVAAHHAGDNHSIAQADVFDFEPQRTFDVVYSWGVLHHTGDMWRAVRRAAAWVAPSGLLCIALYRKTPFCGFWKIVKRLYTASNRPVRGAIFGLYIVLYGLRLLFTGRNPVTWIRDRETERGMKWYTDKIDWLGGYPYESAAPDDVVAFVEALGFECVAVRNGERLLGLFGSGCAEYVFRRAR